MRRALRILLEKGGKEELEIAQEQRRSELLVYLALANFRRRVPFGLLSPSLRLDIRTFWRDYQRALKAGLELLYKAGDPTEIKSACDNSALGWQDDQALYVHRDLLNQLPPILRAYVGCATTLFGDVGQANIIKIHKTSGKVTFLVYDDFDGKLLPELRHRTKVNLKTRWVETFDHSQSGQCLYFKERFLRPDHPQIPAMQAFSAKLRKLGITEQIGLGPKKTEFSALCEKLGLNEMLNRKRKSRKS
jgi:DNA phosphorothioation-associated putative methyltransferase